MAEQLTTTTLAAACGAFESPIKLASTSGLVPGRRLFVDHELMTVVSVSGVWVQVQRGSDGSAAGSHAADATVYVGRADQFYAEDPVGVPPSPPAVTPWINVLTGAVWTVSGEAWVQAAGDISDLVVSSLTAGTATVTGALTADTVAATASVTGDTVVATTSMDTVDLTATGIVDAVDFSVDGTPGIDGTIVITGDGTYTFTKGILTDFTPEE